MSRWSIGVAVAAITAVTGGAVAIQAERPAHAAKTADHNPLATPVLSARRVPELIAAPVADARLDAHLRALLAEAPPSTCLTVAVDGRVVFSANAATPLVPASLEKLVTAEAALSTLGPDAVLTTSVVATAPAEDGVVDGDVWLVGGGDPVLMTHAYEQHFKHQPVTHTDIEALADEVVAAGVREIRGSVVGDDSRYDHQRYLPLWPARFATEAEVGPLGALMVNDGLVAFPPSWNVHTPKEQPAADPAEAAAETFTELLTARGVVIAGAPRTGQAPAGSTEIAKIESPPVDEIVASMLRESDNDTAELLTKEMGVQSGGGGTTAAGIAAIRHVLEGRHLPLDGTVQVDGSGLADENEQTCELIQTLLDEEGPSSTLMEGLPVAGQTGTLEMRFVDTPLAGRLRAKTGTLNQSSALAGFLTTAKGANVSFTLIVNVEAPARISEHDVELGEALGSILDQYPEAPDINALGPR